MTIKCDVLLLYHATPPHHTSGKKARWLLEWSAYDQKMCPVSIVNKWFVIMRSAMGKFRLKCGLSY